MPATACRSWARALLLLAALLTLGGCFSLGTTRLGEDQLGYSRALTDSQKQQTLLNIVQLRYGDTPTFLDATQIISGYQLQKTVTGGFEAFPNANPSTLINGGGTVQLQESPTFTFQPVAGEAFAESYIRPLSPLDLLPLSLSGLPIDVLLRLGVQSINGLQNSSALTQGLGASSPGFFRLLHDLRVLQIAGLLGVRQAPASRTERADKKSPLGTQIIINASHDPALQQTVVEARHLLGMQPGTSTAFVDYGQAPLYPGDVPMLTRSMLGVLGSIAFDIDVPADDVTRGRTVAAVLLTRFENRRAIAIHTGPEPPSDPFVLVDYRRRRFWISNEDFDSKVAFTLVQLLLQLAKTSTTPGTVITIPAG